jgi:hypothetical protein
MQKDQPTTTHQGSCMVWEVNRQGKPGCKVGPLSWTEARILQLSLPTMTGWWHCTYRIEPVAIQSSSERIPD